jgi:hypothetical protein
MINVSIKNVSTIFVSIICTLYADKSEHNFFEHKLNEHTDVESNGHLLQRRRYKT